MFELTKCDLEHIMQTLLKKLEIGILHSYCSRLPALIKKMFHFCCSCLHKATTEDYF